MINLDELIKPKEPKLRVGRLGPCHRCGEFGHLQKSVWTDPYQGVDGWGYLCKVCLEQTTRVREKYGNVGMRGKSVDLSKEFHPVPKPVKKKPLDKHK